MAGDAIPIKRKLGYSVGHAFNDLTAAMWFTYLITYFHEVKNFNNTLAGSLMMIGQAVDAVLTPVIGLASDNSGTGCCKIGRRKTWHLIGTVCSCLGFPFIFIECWFCNKVPDWAQFTYYVPLVILFQFGWACAQIGHLALIPEMTFSPSEKVQLNGWRYAITVLSNMFVYLLAWLFLDCHKSEEVYVYLNKEDAHIFKDLAICVVCIGVFCSGIFYYTVRERENPVSGFDKNTKMGTRTEQKTNKTEDRTFNHPPLTRVIKTSIPSVSGSIEEPSHAKVTNFSGILKDSNRGERKKRNLSLSSSIGITTAREAYVAGILKSSSNGDKKPGRHRHWKEWLKEGSFYQMALIYMCTRLTVNISHIYMPMYITETLHMHKDSIAIVPLVGFAAGFLTSLFMNNTNKLLGRKRTYIIGISCTLGACVWIFFIEPDTASRVYGVAALSGVGGSTVLVTSLAMTADLIDKYSNSAAFVYGAMSFCEKLANGLAVFLIQRYNPCGDRVPTMSPECTIYYRDVLVTVPGGVTFVSLLVLLSTMSSIGGRNGWKDSRVTIQS